MIKKKGKIKTKAIYANLKKEWSVITKFSKQILLFTAGVFPYLEVT